MPNEIHSVLNKELRELAKDIFRPEKEEQEKELLKKEEQEKDTFSTG